ncbi:MAG: hypothetical protein KDB65_09950 [Calditrichaeota bacterium]|nr:hypothetical protein [Calditrichota bacterium]
MWGITGCPGPICTCPDLSEDLYAITATIAPDGGVQVMSWVYSHTEYDSYTPLDCSCISGGFGGTSHRFSPSGQLLWNRSNSYAQVEGNAINQAVLFDGGQTVFAGYQLAQVGRDYKYFPLVYTLNDSLETIRYALVEDDPFGEEYDLPQESKRVLALTDNSFLFYGTQLSGGTIAKKISAFGEVLWTKSGEFPFPNGIYALDNGELMLTGGTSITKIDANGNEVWSKSIGDEASTTVYSATNGMDGTLFFAGSVVRGTFETDIIVWETNSEGVVQDSFSITREGCDDSVHVMYSRFNDQLILASRPRPDCAEPQVVRLTLVTRAGEVLGSSTLDLSDKTYLAGMDMDVDGRFVVAVSTNSGRPDERFYGKLFKFYPDFSLDWSKTLWP